MDLQRLEKSLPEVTAWIAATLDAHRGRMPSVASLKLPRLASYYPAQFLASTSVMVVAEIPMPPLSALGLPELGELEGMAPNGITYVDTIFVRIDFCRDESLYFHELVHAVQWQHLGIEKFLLANAVGLLRDRSYYTNPIDTMAYDLQAQFDRGCQPFDVPSEVRRRLDAVIPAMLMRSS